MSFFAGYIAAFFIYHPLVTGIRFDLEEAEFTIDLLKKQLSDAETMIQSLQASLSEKEAAIDSLKKQLSSLENRLQEMEKHLNTYTVTISVKWEWGKTPSSVRLIIKSQKNTSAIQQYYLRGDPTISINLTKGLYTVEASTHYYEGLTKPAMTSKDLYVSGDCNYTIILPARFSFLDKTRQFPKFTKIALEMFCADESLTDWEKEWIDFTFSLYINNSKLQKLPVDILQWWLQPASGEEEPATNQEYLLTHNYSQFFKNTLIPLARNIIGNAKTDMEKASRICAWVHGNIQYLLEFIYDYPDIILEIKKGACDHYATLIVSLLKAVNIPCREVSFDGWGPLRDGHSAVEAYLDGGWVLLDSTGFLDSNNDGLVDRYELKDVLSIMVTSARCFLEINGTRLTYDRTFSYNMYATKKLIEDASAIDTENQYKTLRDAASAMLNASENTEDIEARREMNLNAFKKALIAFYKANGVEWIENAYLLSSRDPWTPSEIAKIRKSKQIILFEISANGSIVITGEELNEFPLPYWIEKVGNIDAINPSAKVYIFSPCYLVYSDPMKTDVTDIKYVMLSPSEIKALNQTLRQLKEEGPLLIKQFVEMLLEVNSTSASSVFNFPEKLGNASILIGTGAFYPCTGIGPSNWRIWFSLECKIEMKGIIISSRYEATQACYLFDNIIIRDPVKIWLSPPYDLSNEENRPCGLRISPRTITISKDQNYIIMLCEKVWRV